MYTNLEEIKTKKNIIEDYISIKDKIKELKALEGQLKSQIVDQMNLLGSNKLVIDNNYCELKEYESTILDTKKIKDDCPEIYIAYGKKTKRTVMKAG